VFELAEEEVFDKDEVSESEQEPEILAEGSLKKSKGCRAGEWVAVFAQVEGLGYVRKIKFRYQNMNKRTWVLLRRWAQSSFGCSLSFG
jgi:hypothetical protein